MRKILLYIAASLDGYIARRDGSLDWLTKYDSPGEDYGYRAFYEGIDTVLMGRKTYEAIRGFGGRWPYEGKQSVVFSEASINDDRVTSVPDPVPFMRSLRRKKGRDIWLVGGGQIVALFLNNALLDEIILTRVPIILGDGIPLFPGVNAEVNCTLLREQAYASGLTQAHYRVAGKRE